MSDPDSNGCEAVVGASGSDGLLITSATASSLADGAAAEGGSSMVRGSGGGSGVGSSTGSDVGSGGGSGLDAAEAGAWGAGGDGRGTAGRFTGGGGGRTAWGGALNRSSAS